MANKSNKILIIVIVILVALLCAGGFYIVTNILNTDNPADTFSKLKPTFDTGAGEYKAPEQKPNVAIPGWGSFTIPADKTTVSVDFFNPQANEGNYYMTFELKLATGESLYQSGLVKAGDHIQTITLSRGLPKGTYDAYVHIQPYTADDELVETNNADMGLKLIVV